MKLNLSGWKTAPSDTDICGSCRYATIAKGHAESQYIVKCSRFERTMTYKIVECSDYSNKHQLTLSQMNDMAFIIENRGSKIGFVSAKKWKEKYGWDSLPDEWSV